MQLVSRKVLFDIMAHKKPVKFTMPGSIDEDDTSSSAFRSFMTDANKLYGKSNGQMVEFNNDMLNFMYAN